MNKFGPMLRYARKKAGLSQTELGKAGDVNHTVISRWETGERSPNASDRGIILKMAAKLEMTDHETDELLKAAGLKPQSINEIDVDQRLADCPSERSKVKFLCQVMEWDRKQIGEKLHLVFWQVDEHMKAIKEAEQELRAQPTWIAPFAAGMRDRILGPYPTELLGYGYRARFRDRTSLSILHGHLC